jgi:hypothetical protein
LNYILHDPVLVLVQKALHVINHVPSSLPPSSLLPLLSSPPSSLLLTFLQEATDVVAIAAEDQLNYILRDPVLVLVQKALHVINHVLGVVLDSEK